MPKRKLNIRQQRRIHRKHQSGDENAGPVQGSHTGLVVARYGKQADIVNCGDAATGETVRCHIRANVQDIVTGDRVSWQATDSEGVITSVFPRESLMSRPDARGRLRPLAANVNQIAIVIAPEPTPHQNLIDRYLVAIEHLAIDPLLVINKADMNGRQNPHLEALTDLYQRLQYPVLRVSAKAGSGIADLQSRLNQRSTVFVGQSGVGKSSLINLICPEAGAAIGELSQASVKGKHTTTTTRLYPLAFGGNLVDSPGIREFGLWHLEVSQIPRGFVEFRPFLGQCKFRNCLHRNESGCAILEACNQGKLGKDRLASYQQIVNDLLCETGGTH